MTSSIPAYLRYAASWPICASSGTEIMPSIAPVSPSAVTAPASPPTAAMPIAGAKIIVTALAKPTLKLRRGSGWAARAIRTLPRLLSPGNGGDLTRAMPSASTVPESITVQTSISSPFSPSGCIRLVKNHTWSPGAASPAGTATWTVSLNSPPSTSRSNAPRKMNKPVVPPTIGIGRSP